MIAFSKLDYWHFDNVRSLFLQCTMKEQCVLSTLQCYLVMWIMCIKKKSKMQNAFVWIHEMDTHCRSLSFESHFTRCKSAFVCLQTSSSVAIEKTFRTHIAQNFTVKKISELFDNFNDILLFYLNEQLILINWIFFI